jgi:DNA-binding transcriptional LysR family regulator
MSHARSVAHLGNFRLAAKVLHMSQPALSRSIQGLEDNLGVQLFDRLPHGVVPTAFGETFLAKAQVLLDLDEDLSREMRLLQGIDQSAVRVTAAPFPYELLVPAVAVAMARERPDLQCRLRAGGWREATTQVLAREAEFGIGDLGAASADPRLYTELLGEHALHFFCRPGHSLLSQRDLTLARLAQTPFVAPRASVRVGPVLGRLRGPAGKSDLNTGDFVPAWEVESVSLSKQIVAASEMLGAGTLTQIEHELEAGTLVLVPYHPDWLRLSYGFISRRDVTVSPSTRSFMAAFRERESEVRLHEETLLRRYAFA